MHSSLTLLDQALELARRELDLLDQDDLDELEDLARRRSGLMARAWEGKDGCNAEELGERLRALQALQDELEAKARREHERTGSLLKQRKQAGKAISGYNRRGRRSHVPQCIAKLS